MKKKIGILTGGGDCPGLNPAIKGCVWGAEKFGYECVGITDGWKGLVEGYTTPLDREITEKAGLVLDGGRCKYAQGSTVIDLVRMKVVRMGAVREGDRFEQMGILQHPV